ncbi:plasmid segregation protein ParM domain-containing protein [Candidatus Arsenophonus triatominarum]|uniref:plasmid segregation protein ParM domain-containing protein n=1 Tax=Candidatus Arsenophonus triatominarum TaxID=57911 RepID=UPI0007C4FE0B|nr:plasmid segregation protein ParM domain-containing protein [Candidatus Arsenophonus triatominarum]
MLKIMCDDGSTCVKLAWLEDGNLKTHISPNAFREGWKTDAFNEVLNFEIEGKKYTFDKGHSAIISTTNIAFQYSDIDILAIHKALLTSSITPQEIELTVTLPINEFFYADGQKNTENIERKRKNVLRNITINNKNKFEIKKVFVMPESIPAVAEELKKDEVSELEKSIIVDLGGTTMDCGIVIGGNLDVSEVYGNPSIGTRSIALAIIKAMSIADSDINEYEANVILSSKNRKKEINNIINNLEMTDTVISEINIAIENYAKSVVNQIEKLQKVNRIYIAGGGAELISNYVSDFFKNKKVKKLDDAQLALVKTLVHI